MEWTHIYRDSNYNIIVEKMFDDFPLSWKQRPCPKCWRGQDIDLENEYWRKCEHGYEKIVKKEMVGGFPANWKQIPCSICWNIDHDIDLKNEYWGRCEHGYETIVKKYNPFEANIGKMYLAISENPEYKTPIYSSENMIDIDVKRLMSNASKYYCEILKKWTYPIKEYKIFEQFIEDKKMVYVERKSSCFEEEKIGDIKENKQIDRETKREDFKEEKVHDVKENKQIDRETKREDFKVARRSDTSAFSGTCFKDIIFSYLNPHELYIEELRVKTLHIYSSINTYNTSKYCEYDRIFVIKGRSNSPWKIQISGYYRDRYIHSKTDL